MADLKSTIPEEFSAPTALPKSEEEAQKWQEANAAWWETHPMRYDWSEPAPHEEFSREFYEEKNYVAHSIKEICQSL